MPVTSLDPITTQVALAADELQQLFECLPMNGNGDEEAYLPDLAAASPPKPKKVSIRGSSQYSA